MRKALALPMQDSCPPSLATRRFLMHLWLLFWWRLRR